MDNQPLRPQPYVLRRVVLYVFTITLSSFYFGYNIGSFNSAQESVAAALHWGDRKTLYITLFTAAFPLGAIVTSMISGYCMNAWGRRKVTIWTAVAAVGVSVLNIIPNTYTFGLARLLSGALGGFVAVLPPIFLNDVCPVSLYGRAGLAIQCQLTFGIVVGEALALPLPTGDYNSHPANWLWMLVFGFPALVMLLQICLFLIPARHESPLWLLTKGRKAEAEAFYHYLYTEEGAKEALLLAEAKAKEIELHSKSSSSVATVWKFSYKDYLFRSRYRRMMTTSFMLQFLQQWSGVNAIFSYSTSMFDFPPFEARAFSLGLGVLNMVTSLGTAPFVDKFGRRGLMLIGNFGCGASMAVAGAASFLHIKALSIVTLLCFITSFELSLGPLSWVICGEMLYDEAMSFAVLTNWTSYFLVVLTFPLLQAVNIAYCFWLYAALLVGGQVFFCLVLPETKGLTKKEIQQKVLGD